MARGGKRLYNGFLLPFFRRRFIGRRRPKYVPPIINPPNEEPREEAHICEPADPCLHVGNLISNSVVELIIVGSTRGEPISIPGIIMMVDNNLLGILFGGKLITEANSYQIRLPNIDDAKDVLFEDFVIAVKSDDTREETRLALLYYNTEGEQHYCTRQFGMNCSRHEPVFMYDFRFRDLSLMTDIYDSSLNDGHVNVADHSTFVLDCPPVSHSYLGSLVFNSSGNLVGIGFNEIGPIEAFQVSFIWSVLLELTPDAKSVEDVFLNARRN